MSSPHVATEWPDWRGQTSIVIASGPSAAKENLEIVRGRARVIVVNLSWRLAPWADALLAVDGAWWAIHRGVPEFNGLKITASSEICFDVRGLKKVRLAGNNSGTQAINLAALFGSSRIVLVGFDMHADAGLHWHGPHDVRQVIAHGRSLRLRNPDSERMERWRVELDGMAEDFKKRGIEIVNATPGSALKAYPYVRIADLFD